MNGSISLGRARGWLLAVWMALPAAASAGDFLYVTNADDTIIIEDYTGPGGDVVIPGVLNGKTVTAIGSVVFSSSDDLTGVAMPDSITNIGVSAFLYCDSLTNVILSENLVQIEGGAFYGCSGLKRVAMPGSVVRLGELAFFGCSGLTNFVISGGVDQIGAGALAGCENLDAIEVATSNGAYGSADGVLYNKDRNRLIQCPAGKSGVFPLGNGVTAIGELGFSDCRRLTGIDMPDGLLRIEQRAFVGCEGLTHAVIPGSVTQIASRAYTGCGSLTGIAVDETNAFYRDIDGVLFDKAGRILLQYPGGRAGTGEMADGTTDIGEAAFAFCSNLTQVLIGASVTNIGDYAFDRCLSLTNAVIGDEVVSIGESAFGLCWLMTDVAFGSGLRVIGNQAFAGCACLENLEIPNGVTNLGFWAFSSCQALTNLVIPDSVTDVGAYAFEYCGLIRVEIGHGLAHMAYGLFQGCSNLSRVAISSSVSSMASYVFDQCPRLAGVYFLGGPPALDEVDVFSQSTPTVYYLPGAMEWPAVPDPWAGRPTALWEPEISEEGLGMAAGQFGFQMNWAPGKSVVVEACTNMADPNWVPLETNVLADGTGTFNDPDGSNHVGRFYRAIPAP